MQDHNSPFNGALTGMVLTAATNWARYDEDTQRRLRNVRADAAETHEQLHNLQGRGEMIRGRQPVVMDAQVGLALASLQPTAPSVIPSTAPVTRPDLAMQMETAAADMSWPPQPGVYDDRGLVRQAGDMTSMFLALTYEEVRAFLQGLPQPRPPSREAKLQIYAAAHALIAQLAEQNLSLAQYKQAWSHLFEAATRQTSADPHSDPTRAPQVVGPLGANVQSVVAMSAAGGASNYANPNTDLAMRFRIVAGPSAPILPQTALCTIRFGTEFKYRAADGSAVAFQPVVCVNSRQGLLYADSILSTAFTLLNRDPIPAGTSVDAFIAATPGVVTVA